VKAAFGSIFAVSNFRCAPAGATLTKAAERQTINKGNHSGKDIGNNELLFGIFYFRACCFVVVKFVLMLMIGVVD
jgi:hypothetical protein